MSDLEEDATDEYQRKLLLVVGIVIILSFLFGYGKAGEGPDTTIIPG
jgi:hypothetical protein